MKNGRLQVRDIPTGPILEFLEALGGKWANWFRPTQHDVYPTSVMHAMPPGLDDHLVLAKMRRLMQRGYVDGCSCGCRGDFVLTDRGRELLRALREIAGGSR